MSNSTAALKPKVTVVIPALNESGTIGRIVESVKPFADEVVVVDDGSVDATAEIARDFGAQVVSHAKNEGYDRSIEDGFRHAVGRGAEIVVTFDADGQHLADNIPMLIDPILKNEADLVVGLRPYRARVTEHLFAWVSKMKGGVDDPLCGLKAYRGTMYQKIGYFDKRQSIGTELMFTAKTKGFRIEQRRIALNRRKDTPRFGRTLAANFKILKAIFKTLPL